MTEKSSQWEFQPGEWKIAYRSGSIVLQILGILERFHLNRRTLENIHILVEALKHGYASRSLLGDPIPPFKVDVHMLIK